MLRLCERGIRLIHCGLSTAFSDGIVLLGAGQVLPGGISSACVRCRGDIQLRQLSLLLGKGGVGLIQGFLQLLLIQLHNGVAGLQ